MKKRWHYVTAGTLLLSLTMGLVGGASAETTGNTVPEAVAPAMSVAPVADKEGAKPVVMYRMGHSGLLQNEVHERNYLKLLVKAYTPESEAAWLAAFEERNQVEQQFPNLFVTATKAVKIPKTDKDALKELVPEDVAAYVEKKPSVDGQAGEKSFTVTLKKAAIGADGESGPVPALGIAVSDDILNTPSSELPPGLKLQADFVEAVKADDAAAIKELLPKLLDDYKSKTVQLSETAEKIKQEKAKQEQAPAEQE